MAYTKSNTPLIFALIVMLTFVVVAIAFVVYDILVQRRNQNIFNNAARSNAVISSLFPGTLRDRVLEQSSYGIGTNDKTRMKSLLTDGEFGKKGLANIGGTTSSTKPLADLFLETTIMVSRTTFSFSSCLCIVSDFFLTLIIFVPFHSFKVCGHIRFYCMELCATAISCLPIA